MITVTQARENDRTTFCRQFTFNKNGYSNRETAGAIVSGTPVAGISISDILVGSKVALTDPEKLSPNEVGYIVVQQDSDRTLVTPDAHRKSGLQIDDLVTAQQFIDDMTEKAKSVCEIVSGSMSAYQIDLVRDANLTLQYFVGEGSGNSSKRAFWSSYWTNTPHPTMPSLKLICSSSGGYGNYINGSVQNHAVRPLFSIPHTVFVSTNPNASGAYELV